MTHLESVPLRTPRSGILPAPPSTGRSRGPWPFIVVGLLLGHVTLMFFAVRAAVTDGSLVIEPDYYQKAVAWDDHRASQRASAALGWELSIEFPSSSSSTTNPAARIAPALMEGFVQPAGREMLITLRDESGAAVVLPRLSVQAHHRAHPKDVQHLEALAISPGVFVARLEVELEGFWILRFTAEPTSFTEQRDVFIFAESTLDSGSQAQP